MNLSFWKTFSHWRDKKREERLILSKQENKCPQCRGRGFFVMPGDYLGALPVDCTGCNGSGTFLDWEKQ